MKDDDEEFLAEVGDMFGFLLARENNDPDGAKAILNEANLVALVINLTDFTLTLVGHKAQSLGVSTAALLKVFAATAQMAGPELIEMIREEG